MFIFFIIFVCDLGVICSKTDSRGPRGAEAGPSRGHAARTAAPLPGLVPQPARGRPSVTPAPIGSPGTAASQGERRLAPATGK